MSRRFLISDQGDVLGRDGIHEAFSLAMVQTLGAHAASTDRRMIGFVEKYLNTALADDESDDALCRDREADAVQRCRAYLVARGLDVRGCQQAIDVGRFEVTRPGKSINHERQGMHVLRTFCRHLRANGHLAIANPWDISGWEAMTEGERWQWYKARHPTDDRGFRHAGTRFHVIGHRHYPPLVEEPGGCGRRMTEALRALPAPAALVDAAFTMELNGQRYADQVPGNALGWAKLGFANAYMGANKADKAEFSKPIVLPPDVHERLVARLEAMPHPGATGGTMLDWLRERYAAGDDDALRAVPLFPNARGRVFAYPTFAGWIRRAMTEMGVLIRSDVGFRRPSSSWYRHDLYARELAEEIAGATTEDEVQAAIGRVGKRFGHKTPNAVRYAPKVLERHAVKLQVAIVEERVRQSATARAAVPLVPVGTRMQLSEAEALFDALPEETPE